MRDATEDEERQLVDDVLQRLSDDDGKETPVTDPKILICYDGSAAAKEAVERAAQLHPAADVVVLTVWQPMEAFVLSWGLMAGDLGHMDGEAERAAQRIATEGATLARAAGLYPHEQVVRASTSVAHAIVDWCDANPTLLVVVGATGRSSFGDAITGSVANAVVHHAPAPVLVVRLRDRQGRRHHDRVESRETTAAAG